MIAVVGLLGGLLAACDSGNPTSPFPQTPNPTPPSLAPQVMVLQRSQLPAYTRTDDSTISAGTIADQENDQSLYTKLLQEGMQVGARATYADPNKGAPPTPFATVISQVLLFRDVQGATAFYNEELQRREQKPDQGTLAQLTLSQGSADAIAGLVVTVPADTAGDPPSRALFALIRQGRYIAELLGGGPNTTATDDRFAALVTVQEQQLDQKVG